MPAFSPLFAAPYTVEYSEFPIYPFPLLLMPVGLIVGIVFAARAFQRGTWVSAVPAILSALAWASYLPVVNLVHAMIFGWYMDENRASTQFELDMIYHIWKWDW